MAWQSVQPNKVAWGLYSSYLYLQRWQLLCPPRSIQEALRDTLVAISPSALYHGEAVAHDNLIFTLKLILFVKEFQRNRMILGFST